MIPPKKSRHDNRQIIGFSLPLELASEVKAEAAKRGISLRDLFVEIWKNYKAGGRI